MSDQPLVSCIVPAYNSERFLGEALDSILDQTHRPLEVIVADDGSTDRTRQIATSYGDPVRVVTQKTTGPPATRNLGLTAAEGDFIAFLDADDLWHKEKLARQLARFASRPETEACVTGIRNFWIPELKEEEARLGRTKMGQELPGYVTMTLLARRKTFDAVGPFNVRLWYSDSADWFLRAREKGVVIEQIDDVLVFHRMHQKNLTRRQGLETRDEFLSTIRASLKKRKADAKKPRNSNDAVSSAPVFAVPAVRDMRVLVWQESCWPFIGGIQTSAELLLPGLQKRGYKLAVVTVAASDLPARSSLDGIAVHRFPFANALQERDLSRLSAIRDGIARLKQEFAPQLVHVNGIGPSVFFHFATERVRPSPLLVTLHSSNHFTDIPHAREATLLSKTLLAADWITVVSRSMLAHGLALLPEIANRSSIVRPGIAEPTQEPTPLPFERPSILCLANLLHHKGFDLVLQASQSLLRDRPELGIVIAGAGPAEQSLRRLAAELGVADRVEFNGQVSRQAVPSLINRATIVVVPSRREPFGLVALEAALMARPVVAANTGGLAEIVDHGKTGLVVPPDDPKALEAAIADLLGRPYAAAAMGSAARRRALADFTLERHVAAYDSLYNRLAG